MLLRLGSHYWPKDFTPSQSKHFLADYLEDLADFSGAELGVVCREWRQSIERKKFPLVAELLVELRENRRLKEAREREEAARLARAAFKSIEATPIIAGADFSRPFMWWMKPPYLWELSWQESEIPVDEHAAFVARLAKNRKAGKQYWGVNDFYGLARKQSHLATAAE